ncbi:MAG: serine hydrolase [Desulfobacteraceae bacterium]|nr:serine hydrolase [Desulfobacteraceae bacterium]
MILKRAVKITLLGTAVLLMALLVATGWYLGRAMPIGAGFVAKYICSAVFISHRDPIIAFKEDVVPVNPLARFVDYRIDRGQLKVQATALGLFARQAIFRDGCGCTLVVGTTEEKVRAQKIVEPDFNKSRPVRPQDQPWPEGAQGAVDGAAMGVDTNRLQKALDAAFTEPGPEKKRNTRAVVVVYHGRLIAERYAPGFDKDMPLLGWSMAKSVTNALVGILVQEGRFDPLRPAPVPEWRSPGDPRRRITLDQLLRMSSGLAFKEVYAPLFDATTMLYDSYDFAAYAAGRPLAGPPDSRWNYSSGTANIVARVVRQTVEKNYPYYYSFLYQKLFDPIGMYSAVFEPDASGTFVGSSYLFATPRDWARFGQLFLQDGVWQGQQILPEGWVKYTTTPTGGAPKGQYGAFFWLNAGQRDNPALRRWPDAPTDAYAALGFQEQMVIVIPSHHAVLVRFGATSDRSAWNTNHFIRDVLTALQGGVGALAR